MNLIQTDDRAKIQHIQVDWTIGEQHVHIVCPAIVLALDINMGLVFIQGAN